ncbi:MAG: hydrogenase maturation protease [Desulforhopalus sp.]|nr:hydrogenase maturation protease [Desulforhopalus sp.]
MKTKSLVCGIGNPMLKDDRAGIEVAERIERSGLAVDTEIIYGVGFEVNDKLMGYDDVVIIDAAKIGYPPGTITEVTIDQIFTDHNLAISHAVTLGSTLKVGYELFPDEMPKKLRIFLIEAEDYFEFTKECSPKVTEAISRTVEMIVDHFSRQGLHQTY